MKIQIEFIEPKKPRVREAVMAAVIIGLTLSIIFLLLRYRQYYG